MDNSPAQNGAPRGQRLESWKEIAAYLKRDIRTAQRWEKHEALPVHRHLHDERATPYAYSGELDEWLHKRSRHHVDAPAVGNATSLEGFAESPQAPVGKPARLPWVIAIVAIFAAGAVATWALLRSRPAPTPVSTLSVVFAPSE